MALHVSLVEIKDIVKLIQKEGNNERTFANFPDPLLVLFSLFSFELFKFLSNKGFRFVTFKRKNQKKVRKISDTTFLVAEGQKV